MARSLILGVTVVFVSASAAPAQEAAAAVRVVDERVVVESAKSLQTTIGELQQAEKDVKAAEEKLKALREKVLMLEKQAALAKQAAAAAQIAVARGGYRGGTPERDTIVPHDAVERFALLTPGGPLVVQVSLTIDGQPFRQAREKLIAEMIAGADQDKDGKTTWTEALGSARFTFGQVGSVTGKQRDTLQSGFDKNGDGLVQPAEAWQFLARTVSGPAFTLSGAPTGTRVLVGNAIVNATGMNSPDLLALLDTDKDRSLSDKEIAAAPQRMKSRDADDNDVLDAAEVTGAPAGVQRIVAGGAVGTTVPQGALLLGPTATPALLFAAMSQKYKDTAGRIALGCFPAFPQLFADLDKNRNGELEAAEIAGLNGVRPHVELNVDLPTEKVGAGMKVVALAPELRRVQESRENTVLEAPGALITLIASAAAPPRRNFDSIGMSLLMRYDKDANGYLELSEMPGPAAAQFAMYDENGDGKAYPAEIVAGYGRQFLPQMSQVMASVSKQGNALFQTLDANGDNRLGLREMRAAAERIAILDKDANHEVSSAEIPEPMNVVFSFGASVAPFVTDRLPLQRPEVPRPANGVPEWFNRMDRNGDGDLTLKEFLGDEADFKRLDANSDGLLDPKEAELAGR